LASYDAERRPIGLRNVGMATEFYLAHEHFDQGLSAIDDDSEDGRALRQRLGRELERDIGPMFRTIGLQLGYRYEDSPICVSDGSPAPPDDTGNFVSSARPGARAPHVALNDRRSMLDLYGRGFVLVRFGGGTPDGAAIVAAAAKRGVPLQAVTIEEPEAGKLYERKLVLVRPDGHVAWRGDRAPTDAMAIIDRARGA